MKEKFINEIISLSNVAYKKDEIPVGAIVVCNNNIIGYGYNTRNSSHNVLGHAEINAVEMACKFKNDWRLDDCELYTTLLPCIMCTGALVECRIKKVYYLCERTNVCFNPSEYIDIEKIESVDREDEYLKLLKKFFKKKRIKL